MGSGPGALFLSKAFPWSGRNFGPFRAPPSMRPKARSESDVATDDTSVDGVAGRYASALFELAKESSNIEGIEKDLANFQALLDESPDLVRLVRSPVIAADDQAKALAAILDKAGFGGLTANFLKLVTANRRLFVIQDMIKVYRSLAAKVRGEISAEVTSAFALNDEQIAALKETLKASVGKDVTLQSRVDPSILGGLIVKVGSRMIDSSLKTKLQNMKTALSGAGA